MLQVTIALPGDCRCTGFVYVFCCFGQLDFGLRPSAFSTFRKHFSSIKIWCQLVDLMRLCLGFGAKVLG